MYSQRTPFITIKNLIIKTFDLRIISGKYKSIYIPFNKNIKARPTTNTAKEALFNILENRGLVSDLNILDIFAGTGSIAYEFISRGATRVTCVDKQMSCIKFIINTAKKLDMNIKTFRTNAFKYIEKSEKNNFDIVFADPPYDLSNIEDLPELIFKSEILKKNGLLIVEHSRNTNFQETTNFIEQRTYSNVNFSFFKINSEK
jgi:16S rRNA (guanine(966)-N(2))-methyltransferase RsmD